nr:alpha/beta fold hydrolase [Mesorhizobium sp.]
MIHGTPFSSQVWRRIAPLLASRRSVYFFDLLGYGRSAKENVPDVSLGIQTQAFCGVVEGMGSAGPRRPRSRFWRRDGAASPLPSEDSLPELDLGRPGCGRPLGFTAGPACPRT